MSNRTLALTDKLYEYVLEFSLRELPLQQELRKQTAKLEESAMQIAPEQGQFMQLLIRAMQARKCIEIGVFTGYSSLAVALALPEDGRIIACDVNEAWTSIADSFWKRAGVASKITLKLQPALLTIDQLLDNGEAGTFDFAFIDADKSNYDNYYEGCLQLLRNGGLMVIDNVLWSGDVIDPTKLDEDVEAIRQLNRKLVSDERVDLSLLPIADGLTLAVKR